MATACVALFLSLVAVLLGEATRNIAYISWVLLAALAAGDLLLSFPQRRSVVVDPIGEVFVGEAFKLGIAIAPAVGTAVGRFDWPEGVRGPASFEFSGSKVEVTCQAVRRGIWQLAHIWLSWPSRLRLFEFVPKIALGLEIRVIPNIRLVQSGEIGATVQSRLFGVKENRAIGEGSEFHQLRDFVPGMDTSMIDWKRSARHRSLVAKEVRAERNHHIIIALDNGHLMREEIAGLPKIDHAVNAALATAWAAIIGGDLVGLYAYDAQPRLFLPPEPGRGAFARLRSHTSELTYETRESNHTLAMTELNARTPKRSLIIVFSDFVDTTTAELMIENVGILSRQHLIVFVALRDPALEGLVRAAPQDMDRVAESVATNQLLHERRLVFQRLTQLGVTVIDVEPGAVSAKLISTYLEIKAREQI